MKIYQSKYGQLPGTTLDRAFRAAHKYHDTIKNRNPRRRPYVRSRYFKKDKIFLTLFWGHLVEKNRKEQLRRVRLYKAAIDLVRNTVQNPITIQDSTQADIMLHRFYGVTRDGVNFCVQVKQNQRSGRKDLMSAFPVGDKK